MKTGHGMLRDVVALGCVTSPARSRHTSGRTFFCPYGFWRHAFVRDGNVMAVRCVLLIVVAEFRKLSWILEQPSGSCMEELPRWQWLLSIIKVRFIPLYVGFVGDQSCKNFHSLHIFLGFKKSFMTFPRRLNRLKVWATIFYMGCFRAATPKRHKVYSNNKQLLEDLHWRAGYMSKEDQAAFETKLVRKYIDKHGVRRCVGIRDKLRDSQHL